MVDIQDEKVNRENKPDTGSKHEEEMKNAGAAMDAEEMKGSAEQTSDPAAAEGETPDAGKGAEDCDEPCTEEDKEEEKASCTDGNAAEENEPADDEEDVMDGQWESAAGDGGIRGFFKKKDKKDKKDLQIEELTDRVRRQMAEFDNFRKRTEKEKAASFEIGARSVIEKILPVVDNFERGLDNADLSDPFADGMSKIYKQLMTTLEAMDVKPINAAGKPFDPDLHNAVMHVDDDTVGENIVVEELQKGYTYRGTVVRYSMVKVAN